MGRVVLRRGVGMGRGSCRVEREGMRGGDCGGAAGYGLTGAESWLWVHGSLVRGPRGTK